jgi:hypothetical protein
VGVPLGGLLGPIIEEIEKKIIVYVGIMVDSKS